MAGLHVLRLLNEPTAAAIAYGLDSGQRRGDRGIYIRRPVRLISPFYACLKVSFEVLATGGDSALGGDDFDHLVADHFKEQMGLSELTAEQNRALLDAATEAKIGLSESKVLMLEVLGWSGSLTREEFGREIIKYS
ncbi:Hsp70 family protein [Vibrio chagasii]|nr:Hsp70 family protein [Vibrio chagasii]